MAATGLTGLLNWLSARWPADRVWLPAAFLLATLPAGLFIALVVPPGQVPDEQAHIARADSLTHRQWVGQHFTRTLEDGFSFQDAGVLVDPALFAVAFATPLDLLASGGKISPALLRTMATAAWTFRPVLVEAQNVARYPPIFYVPAAAVLLVARHVGASPLQAILGGRIVNLLVFAMLGATALRLAPRPLLLVSLGVPMTLGLAASFNPDGLTVSTAALCVALLSHSLARRTAGWTVWLVAVGLGCVIAQRPPLLPLAALLLLPLRGDAWGNARLVRTRLLSAALAGGIGVVWFIVSGRAAGAAFIHPGVTVPGPLFAGPPGTMFHTTDAAAQFGVLLHEPGRFLSLPWKTVQAEWLLKLREFVGVLGLLALVLPAQIYTAWVVAVPAAIFAELPRMAREWRPRIVESLLVTCIVAASVELIYLALYLTWTPVGYDHVEGVQGRYFLLFPAVAMLAVPGRSAPFGAALRTVVLAGIAALILVGSAVASIAVLEAFYLP